MFDCLVQYRLTDKKHLKATNKRVYIGFRQIFAKLNQKLKKKKYFDL